MPGRVERHTCLRVARIAQPLQDVHSLVTHGPDTFDHRAGVGGPRVAQGEFQVVDDGQEGGGRAGAFGRGHPLKLPGMAFA